MFIIKLIKEIIAENIRFQIPKIYLNKLVFTPKLLWLRNKIDSIIKTKTAVHHKSSFFSLSLSSVFLYYSCCICYILLDSVLPTLFTYSNIFDIFPFYIFQFVIYDSLIEFVSIDDFSLLLCTYELQLFSFLFI